MYGAPSKPATGRKFPALAIPPRPALSISPVGSTSSSNKPNLSLATGAAAASTNDTTPALSASASSATDGNDEDESVQVDDPQRRMKQLQKIISGLALDDDSSTFPPRPAPELPRSASSSSSSSLPLATGQIPPTSAAGSSSRPGSSSSSKHFGDAPRPSSSSQRPSIPTSESLGSVRSNHSTADDEYKITPESLQDLGRLGEGAAGEVRKVLHIPSGVVMAKKVCALSTHRASEC